MEVFITQMEKFGSILMLNVSTIKYALSKLSWVRVTKKDAEMNNH